MAVSVWRSSHTEQCRWGTALTVRGTETGERRGKGKVPIPVSGTAKVWRQTKSRTKGSARVDTSMCQNDVESAIMVCRAPSARRDDQYPLAKILGIWLLAAAPMGIL